jgi:hypothetical protein
VRYEILGLVQISDKEAWKYFPEETTQVKREVRVLAR